MSSAPLAITVLYFARARELAGIEKEAVVLPPAVRDTVSLRAWLLGRCPPLAEIDTRRVVHRFAANGVRVRRAADSPPYAPSLVLALNMEYLPMDGPPAALAAGDEVALIPPISGG